MNLSDSYYTDKIVQPYYPALPHSSLFSICKSSKIDIQIRGVFMEYDIGEVLPGRGSKSSSDEKMSQS